MAEQLLYPHRLDSLSATMQHASASSTLIRHAARSSRLLPCCCRSTVASTSKSTLPCAPSRQASSKAKAPPPKKKVASFAVKKGKKGDAGEAGSERTDTLRQHLYGSDATARRSSELQRLEALNAAIPDPEVHETITRAWHLHKRNQRLDREAEMQQRYNTMLEAISELEKISPVLYNQAVQANKFSTTRGTKGEEGKKASVQGRIPGLFPRQLPVLQ